MQCYKVKVTFENGGYTRFWSRGSNIWVLNEGRAAFVSLPEALSLVACWCDQRDIRELTVVRVSDEEVSEELAKGE